MYVLALLAGLAVAVGVWFVASRFVVSFILKAEQHAETFGARLPARIEAVLCGGLVLICLALAVWVAALITS